MRKSFMALPLVLGLIAILSAGCSDSKSRQEGDDIVKKVDWAERLYAASLAKLGGPVYEYDKQFSPAIPNAPKIEKDRPPTDAEKAALDKIKAAASLPAVGTLNPEALDDVNRAEKELLPVVKDATQAGAAERGLGYAMLGRLAALRGAYYSAVAERAHDRARGALNDAARALHEVEAQAALVTYYDSLLALSNEQVQKMLDQAKGEHGTAETKIGEIDAEAAKLKAERDKLNADIANFRKEAADLRLESDKTQGRKTLDLFEQAQDKEAKASEAMTRVAQIESTVESLSIQRKMTDVDLRSAKGRAAAADEILKLRADEAGKNEQKRTEATKAMAEAREAMEKAAGAAAQAGGDADKAESEAANAFNLASSSFKEAERYDKEAVKPDELLARVYAEQGDVAMAVADLNMRVLHLHDSNAAFLDAVNAAWPKIKGAGELPAVMKNVAAYASDAEKVRQAAVPQYKQAIEWYDKAMNKARRELRWVYQGQIATAWIGLYNLKEPGAADKALEFIRTAVKDREFSPYLKPVQQLEQLLQAGGAPAPAPVPAPAPAPMPGQAAPAAPAASPAAAPAASAAAPAPGTAATAPAKTEAP